MTELRRRSQSAQTKPSSAPASPSRDPASTPWILRPSSVVLVFIFVFFFSIAVPYLFVSRLPRPLLHASAVSPAEEAAISAGVLPVEDAIPDLFAQRAIVCMPTVARRAGKVEYVSNAVKSWRLATWNSTTVRRLVVFDMNVPVGDGKLPTWLNAVFGRGIGRKELPSWLTLLTRESEDLTAPRKLLHGDSEERVKWRSKEALDYAEVLRRCAGLAQVAYVIIVQDDVLFTERVNEVVSWCDANMVDEIVTDEETGRRRMRRVCSVSLFDLPGTKTGVDAHSLDASNMVARVWKMDRVSAMVKYFVANFDEAPVDWLAGRICKSQRRKTLVMEPNPIRHRGKVSSFEQNDRDGLLT